MEEFFEKTWFFWWILGSLAILRWFHIISSSRDFELDGIERNRSAVRPLRSSRS